MKAYLMQKKVWDHAKGTLTAPTDADKKMDWDTNKDIVRDNHYFIHLFQVYLDTCVKTTIPVAIQQCLALVFQPL